MSTNFPIPETKVLAIASHVVYGYVGNTMATFVMQSLGCDVAALNTVHFSNHTGYRQFKGRRHPASELDDLYAGLKQSNLTDFDMLLTGYAPSAEAVSSIGKIAADLRQKSTSKPASFFWVLDPVMGDQGRLYVSEDVVPMYKQIIAHADLVLPNQFEAETLSGRHIKDLHSLTKAIEILHQHYKIPHVVVTSVTFSEDERMAGKIAVVGSSKTSYGSTRLFVIQVPKLDCFFSGTGDMFAALMVVRLREAAIAAGIEKTVSWVSPDDVAASHLPLAKAAEKVLGSMQGVLEETMEARNAEMRDFVTYADDDEKRRYLAETKAAEVRVVRNVEMLKRPTVTRKARRVEL